MRPTRCSPALLLAISTAAVAVLLAGDTAGWSITVEAMKPPSTRDRLQRFLNGSSIVDVDMQPPRAEASGSPNHLLKRTVSAAVEEKLKDAEVRVSDLEARPTLTVAGFARQIQLLTLGTEAKTVQELMAWAQGYMGQLSGNPSDLIQDRLILPLVIVFGVTLVLLIFVPIFALLFWCCRCCNRCGGRLPAKSYEASQLAIVLGFFFFVCIINIFAASVVMFYSAEFTFALSAFRDGALAVFPDTINFAESIMGGFTASESIIDDAFTDISASIGTMTLTSSLDQTFSPIVDEISTLLTTCEVKKDSASTKLDEIATSLSEISTYIGQIPAALDSIDDDVTALVASVSITVSGSTVTYNMPSALSGLSALSAGATMPSVATAITTVTDYRDEIIALPDLAQAGTDVDAAYATQTAAIATAMADIASNFPASSALVTPLTTMINQTLLGVQGMVLGARAAITDDTLVMINTYNGYRNDAFVGEMSLVLLVTVLALVGLIARKHKLMTCMPPCAVMLGIFMWIQFILFYVLSLPFNVACQSKDVVLEGQYALPGVSIEIKPALFISQCREGNNVFEAEINSDGFTAAAMASLALGAVLPIDSMLSSDAISSQIDLSSVDDEFSALTNFDFSAINVVGVDTVTMPFDFADLRSQLVTTMTSLSPDDFDGTLSDTNRDTLLEDFQETTVGYSTYGLWDETYIQNNYVIVTNNPFTGFDVTQAAEVGGNYAPIEAAWALLYPIVAKRYHLNAVIGTRTTTYNSLLTKMDALKTDQLDQITTRQATIATKIGQVTTLKNEMATIQSSLTSQVAMLETVKPEFGELAVQEVKDIVNTRTGTMLTEMLTDNPVDGFADCLYLAEDVAFILESVCTTTTDSISGLWFGFMLLGTFFVFSFIWGMKAKKRVEYLERRRSIGTKVTVPGDAEKGIARSASYA